jgi:DNA-binding beta-propeller fold protein YncE
MEPNLSEAKIYIPEKQMLDADLTDGKSNAHNNISIAWLALRLPLLMLLFFIFRSPVMSKVVEAHGAVIFNAINLLSTPVSRSVFFILAVAILLLVTVLTRKRRQQTAFLTITLVGAILFTTACLLTSRSILYPIPAILLLAANLLPINPNARRPIASLERWLVFAGVGISEVFFFWRHLRPITRLHERFFPSEDGMPRWLWALPGIVLASAAGALALKGSDLLPLEQALRKSPAVRIVITNEDINGIQTDPTQGFLFVVGHGLNHIRRYNVLDWSSPPLESDAPINYAQGFAYNPTAEELYIYDAPNRKLLYFDTNSLRLKRSFDVGNVSPGDAGLAFDPKTDTISISSEADEQIGTPFVLIDRTSGAVIDTQDQESGNLVVAPNRSKEYMDFFRRKSGLLVYDIANRKIVQRVELPEHADRMAVRERENELLVALPMDSRVMRFDADTLEHKGSFSATFGVRTIAIDRANNLLFCASLVNGLLQIIDLATGKEVRHYYLGPWLRSIELLPDRGLAYVSSNGTLFEVRYK